MQEKVKPFSLNSALNRCEMYYFNRSIESNSNLFQTGSAASALCTAVCRSSSTSRQEAGRAAAPGPWTTTNQDKQEEKGTERENENPKTEEPPKK